MTNADNATRGTGDPESGPGAGGADGETGAGDYGYSGRDGFAEGNYSGAYGRGTAGEHEGSSASGNPGAGYSHGGTDIPAPDVEGGRPVRADDPGDLRDDAMGDAVDDTMDGRGDTGRTGRP